jgi:hypothetical protein
VRFSVRPEACWNINLTVDELVHVGTVHDLSVRGVGLIVGESLAPGLVAEAELTGLSGLYAVVRQFEVVHVTRRGDGYQVGCRFLKPLPYQAVQDLLRTD